MKIKVSQIADINKDSYTAKDLPKNIRYLDTGNITKNTIDEFQFLNTDKDTIPSRARRKVKNNSIIYSSVRPNLCHYGILKDPPADMVVSTGFIVIDVKDDTQVDPDFLYYCLTDERYTAYIAGVAETSVSSYPSINPDTIGQLELDIPDDIEEQKNLIRILKKLDEKSLLNNTIASILYEQLALIYDYWFTQFDFPNENGEPYRQSGGEMVHNDDLDQDIPVGWEVKKLGSIIEENEKSPVQVGQAEAAPGDFPFFTSGEKILPYEKSLVDGPFCYLNTGGLADVKFFSGPAAYSTDVWSIYGKDDLTYWLYMFLESIKPQMFQRFFDGSGLKHLQKKRLSSLKVCIPPEDIRKKFNEIAAPILKEQSDIYFENQRLAQLREYLLPLLMSGQVVVNTEDNEESE